MATENLKVKITADASQAKAEIGKFKDSLKGAVSEGEAATRSIGKMTAALGGMLIAVKGIKAAVKNAIDVAAQGDAIKDNAQKVFMNTTAYQEWGYVLKQNGVELGALKTAMRQFAPQVANGSAALAKYGITATDVSGAFEQAIYTIQNMGSEAERIAAATELFGSRALELYPILNLNNAETQNLMATYRALGGTMSNELIAASDVCTDSITAMKAAWGGLKNVLAQYFLPIITKVVQWITIAIAYIRILLSAIFGLKSTFGGGASKRTALPATTGAVASNTGNAAKNLGKAAKHAKELKRTMMGIDELSRLVEQATSSASSPSGVGGGAGDIGGVGGGDLEDFGNLISDETLEKIENFRKKVEEIKDLLHGAYLILKGLVEISLGNFTQGWKDLKEGMSLVWDYLTEKFPMLGKLEDAWDALRKKWAAFREEASRKVADFRAVFTEKVRDGYAKIRDWWLTVKTVAKEFVADLKDRVKDKFISLRDRWNSWTVKAKTFAAELSDKVKDRFISLRDRWKSWTVSVKYFKAEFLNKVKDAYNKFKSWWNGIKGGVKTFTVQFGFVDKLKSAWNTLAGKVNDARAKSTIAATLLPSIPYLAKGGVLTSPTAAFLGEYAGARNNPEIATPQSLMYETIQKANGDLVSAFATMTRQVIAAIEDKDLNVKIGDEAIARSAQRGNTAYKSRTGKALLTI